MRYESGSTIKVIMRCSISSRAQIPLGAKIELGDQFPLHVYDHVLWITYIPVFLIKLNRRKVIKASMVPSMIIKVDEFIYAIVRLFKEFKRVSFVTFSLNNTVE